MSDDAANDGADDAPGAPDDTLAPGRIEEVLDTHLMSHGVYVTDCTRDERGLHVGYETLAPGDGVPTAEVGDVLNLLLDLAGIEGEEREPTAVLEDAGEWAPEDVHGWVFDDDHEERGHWVAREGWFRALANRNISETDFSTLVISTIDS